ncbi:MAG: DUF89 family protein, partial [Spirochaetes bacterium]|nr:DUF89 family protein [Spirochaetota bacterium]
MKTYIDCIPCFYRQIIEASRLSGLDDKRIKKIIDKTGKIILKSSINMTPPEIAGLIYKVVKKESGIYDSYSDIKNKSNKLALSIYNDCKKIVMNSKDRLLTAVEMAIAGNIIDFGVKNTINVEHEINQILKEENKMLKNKSNLFFAFDDFKDKLKNSRKVVYLADNAGEVVFDRILIEEIKDNYPDINIIFAVKEGPAINDALIKDAEQCGINKVARIISTGLEIPGTVLNKCSGLFLKIYKEADMVISKGQGNFESFSDDKKAVFYLFMAKCPVVAKEVKCEIRAINLYFN